MSAVSSNNKRIAKNTIALYFRQILTMIVSLYTSRVVLNTLGVVDYGIYNVVGGVVVMFGFLNSTMASASQRFFAIDISNNKPRLRQTFSLTFLSYLIIAITAFILCETFAVWFLNNKMVIPVERMYAANWVLHFSIITFVVNIMTAPYLSLIIAREKMAVYAYSSVVEAILKLGVVYLLLLAKWDKLIVYSVLMFCVTFFVTAFYRHYCKKQFEESHYFFYYDKRRLKEMFSFAGWNILGAIANVLRSQGINVVLNLFFNPAINAARGIAYQVNSAISSFSNNFYTAVRPQIIKQYANGNHSEMFKIIYYSSKLSFFLLLIISMPILVYTDDILVIWLKTPPAYTSLFVRLIILNSLIEVINFPLVNGLQACGRIKGYQIFISIMYLLILPISFILYKLSFPPETAMIVNVVIVGISVIPRLIFCKKYISLSIVDYTKAVILRVAIVSFPCLVYSIIISQLNIEHSFINVLFGMLICVIFTIIISLSLGLNKIERNKMKIIIIKHLKNFKL